METTNSFPGQDPNLFASRTNVGEDDYMYEGDRRQEYLEEVARQQREKDRIRMEEAREELERQARFARLERLERAKSAKIVKVKYSDRFGPEDQDLLDAIREFQDEHKPVYNAPREEPRYISTNDSLRENGKKHFKHNEQNN